MYRINLQRKIAIRILCLYLFFKKPSNIVLNDIAVYEYIDSSKKNEIKHSRIKYRVKLPHSTPFNNSSNNSRTINAHIWLNINLYIEL